MTSPLNPQDVPLEPQPKRRDQDAGRGELKAQGGAPWSDPDFVDRMFEYLLAEFPGLAGPKFERAKVELRKEFAGEQVYISSKRWSETATQVMRLFNGENAREVARTLGISRASVYRYLKQEGPPDAGAGGKS